MREIGIRELKARLSYYVQLMESGELIAIKVRDRVVGFLSHLKPDTPKKKKKDSISIKELKKKIKKWKAEGILLSGGLCKPHKFEPAKLTGNVTTTEILRKMRDEE